MPIHDWTRAEPGTFRHFHSAWLLEITRGLNRGLLPANYYSLVEQHAAGLVPDVLTLEARSPNGPSSSTDGGVATLPAPPRVLAVDHAGRPKLRPVPKRVVVRRAGDRRLVAVVEVVSPANKASRNGLRAFTRKAVELFHHGIHLMVLDLWPPGPEDPHGLHDAVWRRCARRGYEPPAGKPLTFASYDAGDRVTAYVEPAAVGDPLPQMPLFLVPGLRVEVPLEVSYTAAFEDVPPQVRGPLG